MSNDLPIAQEAATCKMTRRELALRLLHGLAAGMMPLVLSARHPVHRRLLDAAVLDFADGALSGGGAYKPVFLSAEQLATLDKLCDAVIPGSREARSAEFLDLLLSVESEEHREKFAASLSAMDAAAGHAFQKNVVALGKEELRQLLEKVSAEQSSDYADFENLKHWAAGAYYSSEMGMRELGWTPDRVFNSYPVCAHEEGHL